MPAGERIYFLADMHVRPLDAANAKARELAAIDNVRLAAFLEFIQDKASALVLVGDAFNFWFERRGKVAGDYDTTLSLFKLAADKGLDIHHVSGNRDFVVGEGLGFDVASRYPGFFRYRRGFTVSRLCDFGIEPHGPRYRFHHAGKVVTCIHGDSLCTGDHLFMLMRWILMGPLGRLVMRLMPWTIMDALVSVQQGRTKLRRPKADPGPRLDDGMVRKEIAMGADLLICGHIHGYHQREVEIAGRKGRLVALPPWVDGWYGVLEGGEMRIEEFSA